MWSIQKKRKIVIIAITLGAILFFANQFRSRVGTYAVTQVFDGDTIAVNMDGITEKIRLIGIDTPETKDPRKPVQCYGPEASAYSHSKLGHARVKLIADPLSTNRDRYNRLLRYVYLSDGTSYNQALITGGFARAYTGFPFSKQNDYISAAAVAKQNAVGLWKTCGPT